MRIEQNKFISQLIEKIKSLSLYRAVLNNKKPIIIITLTAFVLSMLSSYFVVSRKQTMELILNYAESSKGRYPNGSRFNMFEVKSEDVLRRAIDIGNLEGFTIEQLRDRIDVFSKNSNQITKQVQSAAKNGRDFSYVANVYSVSYSQKNKFDKNNTFYILDCIAKAYNEIFHEKYTEKNIILNDSMENLDDYEYIEIGDMFYDRVSQMERYINSRVNENGTYRASSTDETFQNILSMIQNFKKTSVEQYRGFVKASGLSKDKENYISKLNYRNFILKTERDKYAYNHRFRIDAINKYDTNITGVTFIPSLDEDYEFYMNRTKIGIDYLTKDSYDYGIKAESITKTIESNNSIITALENSTLTGDSYAAAVKTADSMITELEKSLAEISEITLKTDNEYLSYKTREYLTFSMPKPGLFTLISPIKVVFCTGIFFCLACAYFTIREILRERSRKNESDSV